MTEPAEMMIGPLTPTEWMLFAVLDDEDPRNPLPACCADVSEVRDAIFDVLRAGGSPDVGWMHLTSVWHIVESHLGLPITDERVPAPLRKLYETYVAPHADKIGERGYQAEGLARVSAIDPDRVRTLFASISEVWDVEQAEDRVRAVARLGGGFVAYVYDRDERTKLAHELASAVGMPYESVALIVDAARCTHRLPWQPLEGIRG
jgi:hypothetical protein